MILGSYKLCKNCRKGISNGKMQLQKDHHYLEAFVALAFLVLLFKLLWHSESVGAEAMDVPGVKNFFACLPEDDMDPKFARVSPLAKTTMLHCRPLFLSWNNIKLLTRYNFPFYSVGSYLLCNKTISFSFGGFWGITAVGAFYISYLVRDCPCNCNVCLSFS